MALMDLVTRSKLGYYYFPNGNTAIILFLMVPLAVIMSVEWNVVVSSRVSDVRTAQQLGAHRHSTQGIYVSGELDIINLGLTSNLLIIAGILLVVDTVLLYVAKGHIPERRDTHELEVKGGNMNGMKLRFLIMGCVISSIGRSCLSREASRRNTFCSSWE